MSLHLSGDLTVSYPKIPGVEVTFRQLPRALCHPLYLFQLRWAHPGRAGVFLERLAGRSLTVCTQSAVLCQTLFSQAFLSPL